jgi:hypothetical protein
MLMATTSLSVLTTASAAAPTVTAMTYTSDSVLGGTVDTITGTSLDSTISITVGGVSAAIISNTSTTLVFTIPAGTVGTQSVIVTTPGGSVTSSFSITYYTTLTPACGISGYFTINNNNSVVSNSACKGAAVIPNGVKSISVASFQYNTNRFTVDIPATVTSIGTSGQYSPFRESHLTGVTFQPNSQLTSIANGAFRAVPYLQYISIPSSITSLANLSFSDYQQRNGLRWIEIPSTVTSIDTSGYYGALKNEVPLTCIITPLGSTARNLNLQFSTGGTGQFAGVSPTYVTNVADCPAPTISSITASQRSANGGNSVTINGTNMWNVNSVTIGGTEAEITSLPNISQVIVIAPPGTVGAKDVVVSTPGPSATSVGGYTYLAPPTITSLSVTSGPIAGGTTTVVTGTNLGSNSTATLGGSNVTKGTNTATSLTFTTPAGTVGEKDLVLSNVNGTVTSVGAFTYYELTSTFSAFSVAGSVKTSTIRNPLVITATVSYASKVTFKYGNTRIAGCISVRTPTSAPFTVTCTWKPSRKGSGFITATAVPTGAGISTGFATPIHMTVAGRTNLR